MRQFPFLSSRPLFNTDTEHVVYNCGLFSFQPHLFNISSRQGITAHETKEMNHSVFEKRLMEPAWSVQKSTKREQILSQRVSLIIFSSPVSFHKIERVESFIPSFQSCVLMIPCRKRHSTSL